MAKKKQVARFAIGDEKGIYSEVWRVWAQGSDVYFLSTPLQGRLKLSLHASGVCQLAFLPEFFAEHGRKLRSPDRTIFRWQRLATPAEGPLVVAVLTFAAFETWGDPQPAPSKDKLVLLRPPENGIGCRIAVTYSRQDPDNHCGDRAPSDVYVTRLPLKNGNFVTLIPVPEQLADNFFADRLLPLDVPLMMADIDPEAEDLRGISMFEPLLYRPNGPIQIYSLHNMRLTRIPRKELLGNLSRLERARWYWLEATTYARRTLRNGNIRVMRALRRIRSRLFPPAKS